MQKWYKIWTCDFSAPVLLIKAETLRDAIATAKQESASYTCGEEYKQANKCEYYRKETRKEPQTTLTGRTYYTMVTTSFCYGVKGILQCRCGGSKEKCDFFSERRHE